VAAANLRRLVRLPAPAATCRIQGEQLNHGAAGVVKARGSSKNVPKLAAKWQLYTTANLRRLLRLPTTSAK
jgi:hypothetical protein